MVVAMATIIATAIGITGTTPIARIGTITGGATTTQGRTSASALVLLGVTAIAPTTTAGTDRVSIVNPPRDDHARGGFRRA